MKHKRIILFSLLTAVLVAAAGVMIFRTQPTEDKREMMTGT